MKRRVMSQGETGKRLKRGFTTIGSGLLSLVAAIYVGIRADWGMIYTTFVDLNWIWIALAMVVFLFNYILRALRFRYLICTQGVSFRAIMGVTCLHGMFNYLLPAKSGELSYLLLSNRQLKTPLTESTATLVGARFLDFATIALFLPAVLIMLWERLPLWMAYIALFFCGIIYILCFGLLWFLRSEETTTIGREISESLSSRWLTSLLEMWHRFIRSMRLLDQRAQYLKLWLLTVGIWLCVYTNTYFIVLSMNYHPTYIQMIAVSMIMVPLTLLPFQGFANMGTHEAGWVTAFSLFGQSQDVSLAIATSSHLITLSFVLAMGFIGALALFGEQAALKESDAANHEK